MSYKTLKISSLGLLDINLALTLKQSEAESFNLNLDDYTQSEDLRSILSDETESNIINMWNKRRIIMVNGMNAIDLNHLLKKKFHQIMVKKKKNLI